MKIAIIQFPGSNCEAESIRAVERAEMRAEEFLWNENIDKLQDFDGYFLVGGFSYEDRSRSGIIASFEPIIRALKKENENGKPILGVCNGAQILVESGIVPGLPNYEIGAALATNQSQKANPIFNTDFYNGWCQIQLSSSRDSAFTRHFKPGQNIKIPVAHGEGRFVIPAELLQEIKEKKLILFRYSDKSGLFDNAFPTNPNGSIYNIAALANPSLNAMAIMPHPERCPDGQLIFSSMRDYISSHKKIICEPLKFVPPKQNLENYILPPNSLELLIDSIITDNESATIQKTLSNLGIKVKINKKIHWEIIADNGTDLELLRQKIIDSGEFFNSYKERLIEKTDEPNNCIGLLTRHADASYDMNKLSVLQNQFGVNELKKIEKGILWEIIPENNEHVDILKKILATRIIFNPFSQICMLYKSQIAGNTTSNYTEIIAQNLENCLTETKLNNKKNKGKVRDCYPLKDKIILITTDRQSAFDKVLASIPFKGQVLNQTSAWWFQKTKHIIPNHFIEMPNPNAIVAKKCKIFPVEFVVRGFLTGSTDTSVWINYQKGVRDYCGVQLEEGMKKNQKFARPIITPTTKSDTHDRLISGEEIVREGMMTREDWDYTSQKALELFEFGQKVALEHNLILVDTKYEFGKDEDGNILLADEIHTPDSSRYWLADSYEERIRQNLEPENIDKEFLRLWFKQNCDPYNDKILPPAPKELVVELSRRYIQLYEMITGEKFQFPENTNIYNRLKQNLENFFPRAIIIAGSVSDNDFVRKITEKLDEHKIIYEQYTASAHKEPRKILEILENYNDQNVVFVTVAGRSNALSGFVAANCSAPTIACPPYADKLDMLVNIQSTLQMPSNTPVLTVLDPTNAALAVKRILNMSQNSTN